MIKTLVPWTLKPKIQIQITEKLLTLFFHRLCRLELTVLAKKETTWHKNQAESSQQTS